MATSGFTVKDSEPSPSDGPDSEDASRWGQAPAERQEPGAARKLMERTDLLAKEAEHRLLNGLQLVASILAMQARTTECREAALELNVAARRVATIGKLHRRLQGMDDVEIVDLVPYLRSVCDDIAEMLSLGQFERSMTFAGPDLRTNKTIAIPLGLICAELLTNAAKHGTGDIDVRLERLASDHYALCVSSQGPALPSTFNPFAGKGLGMKIVASLVRDITGELVCSPGDDGQGARFRVLFSARGQ